MCIRDRPHSTFQVRNLDLFANVTITLSEALTGFSRTILTHLDGRHIHVTQKRGQVIRPGQVDVIRGEGMMDQRYYDRKGDLFIQWNIDFPTDEWASSVDAKVRACLCVCANATLPRHLSHCFLLNDLSYRCLSTCKRMLQLCLEPWMMYVIS